MIYKVTRQHHLLSHAYIDWTCFVTFNLARLLLLADRDIIYVSM